MTPLGIGIIGCGVISDIYLKNAARFPQLALRAGKHVYSEKPLAVSMSEARQLADLAAARGLRIGCAPDTFLGGAHQTARALVDAGAIGRPVAGTATLMLAGHERWHPNPDFYYRGPGAGPLFDMGPYYITAMVNLLGPVRQVSAMSARTHDSRIIATGPRAGQPVAVDAQTHVAGVLGFASGALVQIVTSFDVWAHTHSPLELYGTQASLRIPDPNRFDGAVMLSGADDWQAWLSALDEFVHTGLSSPAPAYHSAAFSLLP